jgi:integrase
MGKLKKQYTLFRRKLKCGPVWYFQYYDPDTAKRSGLISTHSKSKAQAEAYIKQFFEDLAKKKSLKPTLAEWVQERHFFEWRDDQEWPTCLYCRGRLARSSPDRPAVQRRYVKDCRRSLDKYILPAFGDKYLDQIRRKDLEAWLFSLAGQGLSRKTINNIAGPFRIILQEAERLEVISENPWSRVEPFSNEPEAPRGSLSVEEAIRLMDPRRMQDIWAGHNLYYLINLTAMVTAARLGELLALTTDCIHPDHLDIVKGWDPKNRLLTPTKNKIRAPVSFPKYLFDRLHEFIQWEGFVFSFDGGITPCAGGRVTEALRDALERIGISREEQKRRGLCFHSWRRFGNTYLRSAGLPDQIVRAQTRHLTEAMTDHYTDWQPEAFASVAAVQQRLLDKLTA